MRITSKGQVTIPIEIREKLGLVPDTEVTFEIVGKSARIKKAPAKSAARPAAHRSHARKRGRSV